MVAVCTAERGKPAANISWSHTGNSPPVETLSESHGFFTAESRLELTEGVDVKNLSCAVSHPYWTEEQILVPEPQKGQALAECMASFYVLWLKTEYINYNFVCRCDLHVQNIINKPLIFTLSCRLYASYFAAHHYCFGVSCGFNRFIFSLQNKKTLR